MLQRTFPHRAFLIPLTAILLGCFFPACTMWSQPKASTWKNATGAEQYERLLWDAVKSRSWADVESHLASNFVYLGPQGRSDKQQRLEQLRALELTNYSMGDISVTGQGADAIVTYTISFNGSDHGRGTPSGPVRYMSIWQQQKKGWTLVAMSEVTSVTK